MRQTRTAGPSTPDRSRDIYVHLRRVANQVVATNTLTAISWDTETEDKWGFIAVTGTTLTVPAGYDGLYLAYFRATLGVASGFDIMEMDVSGTTHDSGGGNVSSGTHVVSYGPTPLVGGGTLVFRVRHQTGGNENVTCDLDLYRISR